MSSYYYIKRTARVFVTIYLVVTLTFGLIRFLPEGPFTRMRAMMRRQGLSEAQIAARIEAIQNINPNAPLWQQYIDYMAGFMQGDLGQSIYLQQPVVEVIAQAAPWTIFIVFTSTILMFAIGIVIGALQAYWEGTRFDKSATGVEMGAMSIPFYVLAILLLWIFAHKLGWFPTGGTIGTDTPKQLSIPFVVSAIHHAILPIFSYTLGGAAGQALTMRGNSIQVLGNDYVRVARLRGLSDGRIATRYVARNAILPMYTGLLLLLGFRLGGTVILEQIFSYPGLGYYMIEAINQNDYPLMMGCFLVITTVLVVGVYIADLTYGKIDPRVSTGDSSEAF